MSILRRVLDRPPDAEARYSTSQIVAMLSRQSTGSVSVGAAGTVDTALTHPTVYRSVNKIAGIVANLPLDVYRDRTELAPPPLIANPSPGYMRPSTWKRAVASSMLLQGGAYARVRDITDRGVPTALDLIDPGRVTHDPTRGGWLVDHEPVDEFPTGWLWHVPLMTLPGSPQGVNPLEYARRTLYPGLAAAEFGGNFFRDGAHPSSILKSSNTNLDADAAKALKQRLTEVFAGNSREPLILPGDTEFHQIQIKPDDSQFIELMGFSGGQVAGFFGLMPEHVGLAVEGGTSIQYSNRENRQADLLQDAVMPVLKPVEEALTELLPGTQRAQWNVDAVLRADTKTRYEAHTLGLDGGWLTLDEIREMEDRPPLPADTPDEEQGP